MKKLVDVVAIREVPESVHEMALNALDNITESGTHGYYVVLGCNVTTCQ